MAWKPENPSKSIERLLSLSQRFLKYGPSTYITEKNEYIFYNVPPQTGAHDTMRPLSGLKLVIPDLHYIPVSIYNINYLGEFLKRRPP
jgi:hypothetical protein